MSQRFSQRLNQTQSTQKSQPDTLNESQQRAVHECLRYILLNLKSTIRRSAMIKEAIKTATNPSKIIDAASKLLKDIYGYELCLGKVLSQDKIYFVRNLMPKLQFNDDDGNDSKEDSKTKELTFLILSYLFLEKKSTKEKLFKFLELLNIKVDEEHVIYGAVGEHVDALVHDMMLNVDGDGLWEWGVKAQMTVSKHEVLKFVARMYGCKASDWSVQYAEAVEQQDLLPKCIRPDP